MCLSVDGTWEFIVAECDRDAVASAGFFSEHAAVFAASEWMYAVGIYIVTASAFVWLTTASNWVYRLLDVRGFARSFVTDRIWLVFVRCAASAYGTSFFMCVFRISAFVWDHRCCCGECSE